MGSARMDPHDWGRYASTTRSKSTAAIYTARGINSDLDPKGIAIRESCDSDVNPNSTPIIVALDVTGSMGILADNMVKHGLGVLFEEIYTRKPVSDPHIMLMAVGDAEAGDTAPLQVTQFEADLKLAEQLEKVFLEHGGGSNDHESYNLPWYFAAMKTKCDSLIKRKKKGYLFTIGDECPPVTLRANDVERVIGSSMQSDIATRDLLTMTQRGWEVFHLIIEEGNFAASALNRVTTEWRDLLGQRALSVSDYNKMAEVIVSAIQVAEGTDRAKVVDSWDGTTNLVVARAIGGDLVSTTAAAGVTRL